MSTILSNFYNYYILQTPVELPMAIYILTHVFLVIPLNALAFLIAFKTANKPRRIREQRLLIGAFIMLAVIGFRYYLHYIYVGHEIGIRGMVKFELSEMAMYSLILAVFVIKKDWFYPIAYVLGMVSWFAVVAFPYTVFSDNEPLHTYAVSSFIFHALNGYLSIMLIVARGYQPKLRQLLPTAIITIFIFAFIYLMNEVMDQNFLVLRNPAKIPVLNMVPVPYHISLIYLAFVAVSGGILKLSEFIYSKQHTVKSVKIL